MTLRRSSTADGPHPAVWLIFLVVLAIAGMLTRSWTKSQDDNQRAELQAAYSEYAAESDRTIHKADPSQEATDALIVLDGAKDVQRAPAAHGVSYLLTQPFPAHNALNQIGKQLNELGWTPLSEDIDNPGMPSSHVRGWTEYTDVSVKPSRHEHLWKAAWRDQAGNIVEYLLVYSYPEKGPADLQTVHVHGMYTPASVLGKIYTPPP